MPHSKQLDLPLVAQVREEWGRMITTAEIRGPSRESLQRAVEKYLRDFSPMGYSTRVIEEPKQGEDGVWSMKLSRYSSSD